MTGRSSRVNQCQHPTGWLGRLVLRNMNSRHSKVTDWGLSQSSIGRQDIVLDVGCGGGRTVSNLAAIATQGKFYGIDHSTESVAMAMRANKQWIDIARVEVREASVSRLPFSEDAFDVITAVETHFWRSSASRSIANCSWLPVTQTFRSLRNQAKGGFAASGARPWF